MTSTGYLFLTDYRTTSWWLMLPLANAQTTQQFSKKTEIIIDDFKTDILNFWFITNSCNNSMELSNQHNTVPFPPSYINGGDFVTKRACRFWTHCSLVTSVSATPYESEKQQLRWLETKEVASNLAPSRERQRRTRWERCWGTHRQKP